MPSMVWTDIALVAAVVICPHDFQNTHITVTIPMGCFGKIAVGEMLDIADMCKRNAVTTGST